MGPWVASVPTASHLREGQRKDAWGRGSGHQGALLATLEGKVVETRNGGGDWGAHHSCRKRAEEGQGLEQGRGARLLSHVMVTPAATSPTRLRASTQRGASLSPPELFSGQPCLQINDT